MLTTAAVVVVMMTITLTMTPTNSVDPRKRRKVNTKETNEWKISNKLLKTFVKEIHVVVDTSYEPLLCTDDLSI